MKIQGIITVTPETAGIMLDASARKFKNRPLSRQRVQNYARLQQAGEWAENGQPLLFDEVDPEIVVDGQHRLAAHVMSGITHRYPSVLVDKDTFRTIDQGGTRTAADLLAMLDIPNAKHAASIAVLLLELQGAGVVTKQEAVKQALVKNEQIQCAMRLMEHYGAHAPLSLTRASAAYCLCENAGGANAASHFFAGVTANRTTMAGESVKLLRFNVAERIAMPRGPGRPQKEGT